MLSLQKETLELAVRAAKTTKPKGPILGRSLEVLFGSSGMTSGPLLVAQGTIGVDPQPYLR